MRLAKYRLQLDSGRARRVCTPEVSPRFFFASDARRERARLPAATTSARDALGDTVGRRVRLENRWTVRREARASRHAARPRAGPTVRAPGDDEAVLTEFRGKKPRDGRGGRV